MRRPGLPLFSIAFRPFFLLGSMWSAAAVGVWVVVYLTGSGLPIRLAPVDWHIHEMVFGFALAAIAGFILTAVANWTGRPPVRGAVLAALTGVWALARGLNLVSSLVPLWLTAAVDLAFPAAITLLVLRETVAARNWRNLMMAAPIAVLGIADLLMYLEAAGRRIPAGLGWRLALAAVITLMAAIGGRIIPVFTRNWLAARGAAALPSSSRGLDRAQSVILHSALLGWAVLPDARAVAVLLILGAALSLVRLAGWRGLATRDEPLLAALHVGYLWMIFGAGLLGVSILVPAVPGTAAIHALTAGAIGTMVIAVMSRVCRGHTGRALTADRLTVVIYALVNLAAMARVVAALWPAAAMQLFALAAALWIAGYLLFAAWCAPVVLRPRPDGKA
jgi:uncharacterized protein involved in response to NO